MKTGYTKTALLETDPKSAFSLREIPIPDSLAPLLEAFKKEGQEYVLYTDKPMEPRWYQRTYRCILSVMVFAELDILRKLKT